ncbi:hypothetical protein BH10PSE2_BH10PSE2_06950 [soil metagenome]
MKRFLTIRRLSILFVALFGVALLGVFLTQHFYYGPEKKCLEQNRWWWAEERQCVTPTYLPDITGRPAGMSRAEASAEKNRELVAIEKRLQAEADARQAATDRDTKLIREKAGI